ncbi:hypothetical protein F7725_022225, partial [Dissostichus mawsoni]
MNVVSCFRERSNENETSSHMKYLGVIRFGTNHTQRVQTIDVPRCRSRKATVVWTCTLVLSLFLESCHTQKLNVHWGPQSMMYLKGKHGRRFVSEEDNSVLKQSLQGWYAALRGIQRLQSQDFSKTSHTVSLEKVL